MDAHHRNFVFLRELHGRQYCPVMDSLVQKSPHEYTAAHFISASLDKSDKSFLIFSSLKKLAY
jgi:hypothetical protein